MAKIYAQANIRAQLSILSNPPVAPLDINTGLPPQFWRAGNIQIDVGIFDGSENGLDLSNLTSLQLTLSPTTTSPVPWLVSTVASDDIISPIDFGDWADGLTQNASFVLTAAQTDLGLEAGTSRQFWCAITGFTEAGAVIVYGAGYITIYQPSSVYPPPQGGVVSLHDQTAAAPGTIQVVPTGLIHTEEIDFTGGAGTYSIVLQAAGYQKGSLVDILCLFADAPVAGLIINVYSGSLSGSPILTYTTDAFQPNALLTAVVNATAGYDGKSLLAPAFL